jgi:SAM-dependent methyltransferase
MNYKNYVGFEEQFDAMGEWQYKYILNTKEVNKKTKFLDVGCGTMRLGKHIIPYLNKNKYTGIDFNEQMVNLGIQKELNSNILKTKQPKFIFTDCFDTSDCAKQDFIWINAVFNHLKLTTIKTALQNLLKCSHTFTHLYFTYWEGASSNFSNDVYDQNKRNHYHTKQEMLQLCEDTGWEAWQLDEKQLLGQSIICARTQEYYIQQELLEIEECTEHNG